MKIPAAFALLAAACAAGAAPDIRFSGRVVDHAGTPLGNCAVTFGLGGPKAVTHAAQGTFTLTGSLPIRRADGSPDGAPSLRGSRLSFSVPVSRQPVRISIHDARGALEAPIWSGYLGAGRYDIDAMAGMPGRGSPAILRLRIGNTNASFRLPMRGQADPVATEGGMRGPAAALAKSAGNAGDTLTVSCPDFPVKKFPVPADTGSALKLVVRRPNIILFLADDLGWMDLAHQGSGYYVTPHLDGLASQSVRFPNAYAHPLCSPTRAAILSGKEPARLRLTTPAGHLDPLPVPPKTPAACAPDKRICEPQSARQMDLEEFTIAEALKEKGYQTAFLGKWHLGKPEKFWPEAQGFDVDIGLPDKPGPCSYFDPYCAAAPRLPNREPGDYIVDRITDDALAYIDGHKHAPFFMCLWQFGVHAPFQAKPEYAAKYQGKADPRGKQEYPIMAAMIQSLDESMGRLQKKLADLALDTNTILVFYSDNGGNMYDTVQPGRANPFPTSNHPLKMGKGNAYEGGVRVPLLVKWPGVAKPGSVDSSLVNETDLYPTFLEMAGITSASRQTLDGYSLAGRLRDGRKPAREAVFCHFPHTMPAPGNRPVTSMRKGDWKLMRYYGEGPGGADKYELYDLARDIGEANDVSGSFPEVVRTMALGIQGFLAQTKALIPGPNASYRP